MLNNHFIEYFRSNNCKEDGIASASNKNLTRSQKSFVTSACSNTSMVYDVFDKKEIQTQENNNCTSASSSNQSLKYSNENSSARLNSVDIDHITSFISRTVGEGFKKLEKKYGLNNKETETSKSDKEYEEGDVAYSLESRRQSSGVFESNTPLLAHRRRRSSVGHLTSRCPTRSGKSSSRIKSGKTKRPTFVANTLVNHTMSPKLSSSDERGPRLTSGKAAKSKKMRCSDCRKRLNITNMFVCRCERKFCAKHRHAESHSCTYDYKADGKKYLEKANPIIPIPKLPKI